MPPRLSLSRIVDAAVKIVDEADVAGLTMRQLGDRLGVKAMALYRYVTGRDELLDLLAAHATDWVWATSPALLSQTSAAPASMGGEPGRGWVSFLRELAHRVRHLAREHPNLFVLMATRRVREPGLRPPLGTTGAFTSFVQGLSLCGFSDEAARTAYRRFTSFLLGHLLLEVSQPPGPERLSDRSGTGIDDTGLVRGPSCSTSPGEDFEADLAVLITHLSGLT